MRAAPATGPEVPGAVGIVGDPGATLSAAAPPGPSGPGFELDALRLVRLLQLASPALPIGAYSYSQGLEWAVESGQVRDEATSAQWIGDSLALSFGCCEAPVLVRLVAAWERGDAGAVVHWNAWFRATRDTAEMRAETTQMGQALCKLLRGLALVAPGDALVLDRCAPVTLPSVYALAARCWDIAVAPAIAAYTFAWAENQVLAAVKLVPLGQAAGQRLLAGLGACIPEVCKTSLLLADKELCNFAPGLSIASCRHETQYTRLFRS